MLTTSSVRFHTLKRASLVKEGAAAISITEATTTRIRTIMSFFIFILLLQYSRPKYGGYASFLCYKKIIAGVVSGVNSFKLSFLICLTNWLNRFLNYRGSAQVQSLVSFVAHPGNSVGFSTGSA